jgi:hypothetical protein
VLAQGLHAPAKYGATNRSIIKSFKCIHDRPHCERTIAWLTSEGDSG